MNGAFCARVASGWVAVVVLSSGMANVAQAQEVKPPDAENGRMLFHHEWTAGDPLSPNGDGLGPMHNATSCVACHRQGGVGGGGGVDNNVDLLSVVAPKTVIEVRKIHFRRQLVDAHPGFGDYANPTPNIVLHRFGGHAAYDLWRLQFLGLKLAKTADRLPDDLRLSIARSVVNDRPCVESTVDNIRFRVTQRNTPALFGSSLIDTIPRVAIEEVAHSQKNGADGVSGRVSRLPGGIGRFGWRGQIASLEGFVLGACANELGLSSSKDKQARNPLIPGYSPRGIDMSDQQCVDLVAFVRDLPVPQQIKPARTEAAEFIDHGEAVFHKIGCATCHVRKLGDVDGLFSDLLLHDLGPELSDPVPAGSTFGPSSSGGGYYFGSAIDMFVETPAGIQQEWRTPPLWGVADSAPYMHDGRAATLDAAIRLHGGEAKFAAEGYRSLNFDDRTLMLAFLNTLKAPRQP